IRSAYLEYAGVADVLAFQGGRMLLTDLGQTWVDGLVVRAGRERGWLAGAFGGLSPDPLDYSLSLDYQTFGVFGGWTGDGWLVRLAFNWYMANLSRYHLVYGILGGFAGLVLWIYYTAIIVLLGIVFADLLGGGTARKTGKH
ncbi:MAG TPA: YhjD/YihY/BrkB family envelope integrity protein, partial [Candidatus Bipolaricaulis anaerobius]|nr:YhjD/YihY/BrkB family envelope integrity protein [Candidatus Bipolaricaulis anaerobius]